MFWMQGTEQVHSCCEILMRRRLVLRSSCVLQAAGVHLLCALHPNHSFLLFACKTTLQDWLLVQAMEQHHMQCFAGVSTPTYRPCSCLLTARTLVLGYSHMRLPQARDCMPVVQTLLYMQALLARQ